MIKVNLMPRQKRKETLNTLAVAVRAGYKFIIYHQKLEIEAKDKLIEAYERYFNFIE